MKASYGSSETISIDSISCSQKYVTKWKFTPTSGSAVEFTTTSPLFKASDRLTAGQSYTMNVDLTNTNMNVVYGS